MAKEKAQKINKLRYKKFQVHNNETHGRWLNKLSAVFFCRYLTMPFGEPRNRAPPNLSELYNDLIQKGKRKMSERENCFLQKMKENVV